MADGPFDMSQRVTRLDQREGFSQLAPATSGATCPQPRKCSCELRALKNKPERTANKCQNSQDREDGLGHHPILSRMLHAWTPGGRTMRPHRESRAGPSHGGAASSNCGRLRSWLRRMAAPTLRPGGERDVDPHCEVLQGERQTTQIGLDRVAWPTIFCCVVSGSSCGHFDGGAVL